MPKPADLWTRRALLKRASQIGFMGAAAPLALNLAGIGEAAAFDASDYKAIVCLFLFGGNDHANTVVPYDLPNYDRYSAIRGGGPGRTTGGIALGRAELDATALTSLDGRPLTDDLQYALHPALGGLKALFDQGRLAVQLNVGPLLVPLTLAQYQSPNRTLYPLPPKLFSHNDQQSVWQALDSEGATVGWGGRLGDIALASNGQSLLTCISVAGNAVFVAGRDALQYQISPAGATPVHAVTAPFYLTPSLREALSTLITQPSSHVLENEFARVTRRSMQLEGTVSQALAGVPVPGSFATVGEGNPLARQLRIVARLIGARGALGSRRQVFFVSMGGFDTHNLLMQDHPRLMAQLNEALSAFYAATVELGVAEQVVAFTASDFGRTLSSNFDGSDHGWGGHHFVVGGAVKGGRFYGVAPHVSLQSNDQVGQGRLLPSTAVDEFATTLARWFGVSATELPDILPHSGRFAHLNAGFL